MARCCETCRHYRRRPHRGGEIGDASAPELCSWGDGIRVPINPSRVCGRWEPSRTGENQESDGDA